MLFVRLGLFPEANLILGFLASLGIGYLSFQEHRRSIRSADLILLFLLASSICDSIWLVVPLYLDKPLPFVIRLLFKLLLLVFECQSKDSILLDKNIQLPPEETANLLSRAFFWWIHDILAEGYSKLLVNHELPPTDRELGSSGLRRGILRAWDQRGSFFTIHRA